MSDHCRFTEDPRSRLLGGTAGQIGDPSVEFAVAVEQCVEAILAELKPGREGHANVEFYAGVVMELCGLPRQMFTPTFAAARVVGRARTSWNWHRTRRSSVRRRGTSDRNPGSSTGHGLSHSFHSVPSCTSHTRSPGRLLPGARPLHCSPPSNAQDLRQEVMPSHRSSSRRSDH